jgi:NACalpha-BTF3-like transcription factor
LLRKIEIKLNDKDVETLAKEFDIEKPRAKKVLLQNEGNLSKAIKYLIDN